MDTYRIKGKKESTARIDLPLHLYTEKYIIAQDEDDSSSIKIREIIKKLLNIPLVKFILTGIKPVAVEE